MALLGLRKTDTQLQADVIAELARDWRFLPAEVGVEVDNGVVTLTGTVSSYAKLTAAAEIAVGVAGVKDLANKLEVHVPSVYTKDDTDIAKAARNALQWESDVPEESIDVIVRQGVVTLRGEVNHWYQRRAAADAVTRLTGVVSVRNDIQVVPMKLSDLEIRDDIERALERRMPHVAKSISVTARSGAVMLSGRVPTFADRAGAERIAWNARGVHSLRNTLVITD